MQRQGAKRKVKTNMDIGSDNEWPAAALSNFAPYSFVVEGIECNSMEGFLQSLKFEDPEIQQEICKLVGKAAKFKGKKQSWQRTQMLWWQGKEIDRHSEEYQVLLDKAFCALAENPEFKQTLLATNNAELTHSIGKNDPHATVLTQSEFCLRLMGMRQCFRDSRMLIGVKICGLKSRVASLRAYHRRRLRKASII